MALVIGTNAGFVKTSPSADPAEGGGPADTLAWANKDTSPPGAIKVTEIGWWCSNATQAADYDVGIYNDNSIDDNPESVVGALSTGNAKGTTAGWKKVTGLNITITPNTVYWIAMQLDNTSTTA